MAFTVDSPSDQTEVMKRKTPFFEDAQSVQAAGYDLRNEIEYYQTKLETALRRMEATQIIFINAKDDAKPLRYGYRITFRLNGIPGRIDILAMPLKKETPARKLQALKQALYIKALELEAALNSRFIEPGAIPLIPYLIGDGDMTVKEAMTRGYDLPMLTSGGK